MHKLVPTRLQYIVVAVATATLVLSNYWLIDEFNLIYRFLFVSLFPLCLMERTARQSLRTAPCIFILVFVWILAPMVVLEHGDRARYTLAGVIKNIPLFMVGYMLADKQILFRRMMLTSILVVYAALAARYLSALVGQDITNRLAAAALFTDDSSAMVGSLITHFPTQVMVIFLCISMLNDDDVKYKTVGVLCAGILVVQVLFSFWTTPVLMLVMGVGIATICTLTSPKLSAKRKVIYFGTVVCFILFALGIIGNMVGSTGQAGSRVIERSLGVLTALFDFSPYQAIDYFSDGRLSLAAKSMEYLVEYPIWGAGDYWLKASGGHSFWIDALAKYGVIGSWPLWAFGISALAYGWQNIHSPRAELIDMALIMVIGTWFFSAFINPYFLGQPGYFLFLSIGMASGRYAMRCRSFRTMAQTRSQETENEARPSIAASLDCGSNRSAPFGNS